MIVGITGTDGAGKGTVVDYLVEKYGFAHYQGRTLFIKLIEEQGLENNRANMRLVANDFRRRFGNDAGVKLFLSQAKEKGELNVILDSIRAIAEAETLKMEGGILLAVDADQIVRYERIVKRASSSDHVTFEQFVSQEALEMDDPDPNGMQKAKVIEMADYTVTNNGSLEELHAQIEAVLEKIEEQ